MYKNGRPFVQDRLQAALSYKQCRLEKPPPPPPSTHTQQLLCLQPLIALWCGICVFSCSCITYYVLRLAPSSSLPFVASQVAFPFFVSFLLLFLVVILPLLLGIVLDAYAQQHARQHERNRRKVRTYERYSTYEVSLDTKDRYQRGGAPYCSINKVERQTKRVYGIHHPSTYPPMECARTQQSIRNYERLLFFSHG